MLNEELEKRCLPNPLRFEDGTAVQGLSAWETRRKEIQELYRRHMMGFELPFDTKTAGILQKTDSNAFAGKADYSLLDIQVRTFNQYFSFPCHWMVPKGIEKAPVFVYISFSPTLSNEHLPTEEILDHGYAVASFCYQDIAPDKDDHFENGAARLVSRNPFDSWGKISMWAWAASRVLDVLQTMAHIDTSRIAVIGHSRLGKTALWCGALDERFSLVVSNESGAGGAALFRGKTGEKIENLVGTPAYWFCGNFKNYAGKEDELPFDQHCLLSLIAPRRLYVCSALQDDWADPQSEFLSCIAAEPAYSLYGLQGLVTDDKFPKEGECFPAGHIGYHLRGGTHFFSRYDWRKIMEYREKHSC